MITREQVNTLKPGQVLYHKTLKNADKKTPLKARVNGHPQTWKREPDRFRVPMKHGFKNTFQLTNANAMDWTTDKP